MTQVYLANPHKFNDRKADYAVAEAKPTKLPQQVKIPEEKEKEEVYVEIIKERLEFYNVDYNEDGTRGDDIRVNGGKGYNNAIIPLLEAFGATGLKTQAQYDAQVLKDGSSLKYILETLIGEANEILATPLNELLSRLANLFYFIGSGGINTIAENLLAPVNTLIAEVLAITVCSLTLPTTTSISASSPSSSEKSPSYKVPSASYFPDGHNPLHLLCFLLILMMKSLCLL